MGIQIIYIWGNTFADYKSRQINVIKNEILGEKDDYILNVGEVSYIKSMVAKYFNEFPILDIDGKFIDVQSYSSTNLCIPFSGKIELLAYTPNSCYKSTTGVQIVYDGSEIMYDISNFYTERDKTVAINNFLQMLLANYRELKQDFDRFNNELESIVTSLFSSHKQYILNLRQSISQMGIPVRRRAGGETYSIPNPELRKKIILKPEIKQGAFVPEPTVSEVAYFEILKTINDTCLNFERLPSLYKKKSEEELRDHILFVLDPLFEIGSATGETFNKSGKTDILLKYESHVLFIAECKFWHGDESFLKTIDQLLGYLTWRNSKTSIVVFVNNKDMTSIVKKISSTTARHLNFVKEIPNTGESWFNFIMNLPSDPNKEISMAVQLFHIP